MSPDRPIPYTLTELSTPAAGPVLWLCWQRGKLGECVLVEQQTWALAREESSIDLGCDKYDVVAKAVTVGEVIGLGGQDDGEV